MSKNFSDLCQVFQDAFQIIQTYDVYGLVGPFEALEDVCGLFKPFEISCRAIKTSKDFSEF